MTITPASLAAINGVSVQNEQFAVTAAVIPQRNVIVGTYDETTFTSLVTDKPFRVFSAADVGAKTGFGFMLHRLALAAEKGGRVETWIVAQEEASGASQAAGSIEFAGPASAAGVAALYIAADRVAQNVANGKTSTDVVTDFVAAINGNADLPVTASAAVSTLHLFSKSSGPWGNDITLAFNLTPGESLPAGLTAVTTPMSGGAGIPDIQDALDSLGTGDGQNEKFFTNLIHGYGQDHTTLDAISEYNGVGNLLVGNYRKEVARPFRSLIGDTTPQSDDGLSDALYFADLRRNDRTNGMICVPGSYNHPQEIAAQSVGVMAAINSIRAEEGYIDKLLNGVTTGETAERWTNEYDNRDEAVRGGISTSMVKNGSVVLQNLVTFYRPADIAPESNGYRAMRNISIIQNMLDNYRRNFEREKWKGISIVQDVTAVANVNSRLKARDVDSVLDDLVAIAESFEANAWIYTAAYTKSELQKGDKVVLRAGLTGFDITFPVILSGEGGIYNSLITFDTSIAVLLGGE